MISSLENMRGKALLMALNSTLMSLLVHKAILWLLTMLWGPDGSSLVKGYNHFCR